MKKRAYFSKCFNCPDGYFYEVVDETYHETFGSLRYTVENASWKECNKCGEQLLPLDAKRRKHEV